MLTVRQLKEFLEKCDDNMPVVSVTSNYEQGNSYKDAYATMGKYAKRKRSFFDDFDGDSYTSEVYEYDSEGMAVVVIRG